MFNKLFAKKDKENSSRKGIFGVMLAFGIVGLIASFTLTLDKFKVLQNPHAVLSCSLNIVLNCSTVMQTWQSSLFGFPNMIIGLMAFPVIITVATLGLIDVKLPKKFWVITNAGYALGTLFSYWLFFESLYSIQVLCPWCLTVTFSTTMILASITRYNLLHNNFDLGKRFDVMKQTYVRGGYDKLVVACWIVLLVVLVYLKFGNALFAS